MSILNTNEFEKDCYHMAIIKGPIFEHRKTKKLLRYLPKRSIVLLWHEDLDGVSVDGLISAKVKAVINGKMSLSGKYVYNQVERLLQSGIAVFDVIHFGQLNTLDDGDEAIVKNDRLFIIKDNQKKYMAALHEYSALCLERKILQATKQYPQKFD